MKWFATRGIFWKIIPSKFPTENWITIIFSSQNVHVILITPAPEHTQSTTTKSTARVQTSAKENCEHGPLETYKLLVHLYIWENRIVVSSELIAGSHEGNFQMQFSFDCWVLLGCSYVRFRLISMLLGV